MKWFSAFAAAVTVVAAGAAIPAASAVSHSHGTVGNQLTLASGLSFGADPIDVAADDSGTAYIGWISSPSGSSQTRRIHLCVLPTGAKTCKGGMQTFSAVDGASAANLRVLSTPSGHVTLLWFHNTASSGTSSEGGAIAEVKTVRGANPTAPADIAQAPSGGSLLDAEYAPNGKIWLVTNAPLPSHTLQVTPGIGTDYQSVHAPFSAGQGQLAFTGKSAVVVIDKYASAGTPANYAVGDSSASFGAFTAVKHTWTTDGTALKNTPHGLRLITTHDNADYRPVVLKWTGHGFGKPMLTADRNSCAPSSHDASRDSSGRLVDVGYECDDIAVADYADDTHAAIHRFTAASGTTTVTNTPHAASGVRGIATVVWSTEKDGASGDALHVNRVALPDTTTTVHKSGKAGKVNLIGPTSCLPPVLVHVKVGASPSHGWSVDSRTLTLGGDVVHGRRIDGASLTPGKSYTLDGKVVFKNGHKHSTITASLKFTTCAKG